MKTSASWTIARILQPWPPPPEQIRERTSSGAGLAFLLDPWLLAGPIRSRRDGCAKRVRVRLESPERARRVAGETGLLQCSAIKLARSGQLHRGRRGANMVSRSEPSGLDPTVM